MSPSRAGGSFRLVKWYLDCVDDRGNVAIGYWAALSWRTLAITWQRATIYPAGGEPLERSSLGAAPPPARAGDRVVWAAHAVGCEVELGATAPSAEHRLLDTEAGGITWRCEVPAARARCTVDGAPLFAGTGYAERMELTLPPWRLPIDELRWGRWIAADASRSVAWIDWRGPAPLTLVLADGVAQPGAVVGESNVELPHATLELGPPRTLHEESVRAVVNGIAGLGRLLRRTRLAIRDDKWCAEGTLALTGGSPLRGWAIHESVWFG